MSLDSLLRSGRQIVVLLEAESSAGPRYASNVGYVAAAADPVAPNRAYPDWLSEVPEVRQSLPDTLFGRSEIGWSDAIISNPKGVRDSWLDEAWDGRAVRLLVGDAGWTLDQFVPVFAGVATSLQATADGALRLAMSDPREQLNRPVQDTLIATGPAAGEPSPLCWGTVFNIEPVLIDAPSHTYRVHEGPVVAIDDVRVGGLTVSYTNNGDGTLTLGVFPDGRVTADVRGGLDAGVPLTTAAQLIRHISARVGVTEVDADAPLFQPERTNALVWSGDFGNPVWTKSIALGVARPSVLPPPSSAYLWTGNGSNSASIGWQAFVAAGETRTSSWWVERGSADTAALTDFGVFDLTGGLWVSFWRYDWSSGALSLIAGAGGTAAAKLVTSSGPNGGPVRRLTLTLSLPAGTCANALYPTGVPANTDSITLHGAQDEIGGNASAYIPTSTGPVTRAVCAPQPLGVYVSGRRNAIDVLDEIAQSVGAWWGFSGLGELTAAVAQVGAPALTLTPDDVAEFALQIERIDTPSWRRRVGYRRNHSVQTDGLFAAVPEDTRQRLGREWDVAEAGSIGTRTLHPLALDPDLESTLLVDGPEARAEAARRLAMFGVPARRFRAAAFRRAWPLCPGDTVRLTHPRFGLSAGRDLLVTSVSRRVSSRDTVLTLWAGGTLIASAPAVLATDLGEVISTEAGDWITVQEAA